MSWVNSSWTTTPVMIRGDSLPGGCLEPHRIRSARVCCPDNSASIPANSADVRPAWFLTLITVYTSTGVDLDHELCLFEHRLRLPIYCRLKDRTTWQSHWHKIMVRRASLILSFGTSLAIVGCIAVGGIRQQPASSRASQAPKLYRYEVLGKYPHDRQAFTQGMTYHDGYLYESTGLQGQSSLRKVDLNTGRVLRKVDLDSKYFAEGLTIFKGKIYQLTWLSGIGFVYDVATLDKIGEFHYEGEGWGLTNDQRSLIMSDGSNSLKFLDPVDFKIQRSIEVYYQGRPLTELNELEYINGEIFSNVWHKNIIVRIDPEGGRILGIIDLTGLGTGLGLGSEDVLNGIAYLPRSASLLVTGKRWPFIFRIRAIASGE